MEGSETPNGVGSEYDGSNDVKENGKVAENVKTEPGTNAKPNGTAVDAAAPSMLIGGASGPELQNMKMKGMETNGNGKQSKGGETHRIDIDSAMTRFQRKLGRNWDKYRDAITHFLMGKLTRPELTAVLGGFLTPLEVRTHNYLLLAILANSLREPPPGDDGGLSGWKARGTTRKANVDTPTELLHREIMALPARERKRIKNIARDNKRPNVPVPLPCLIATRQAMLPHLPYVQDRRSQPNARAGGSPLDARSQPGSAPISPQIPRQALPKGDMKTKAAKGQETPPPKAGARGKVPGRPDFSSPPPESEIVGAGGNVLNPGRLSGPLTWTQDIIHGFEAPLAGEVYELPDDDSISERVLGIALEHGITNGYEAGVTDVLLAGVEQYLTTILSTLVPTTANREVSPTDPVTARDLQTMFTQNAGRFREFYGPLYRISTHYLQDEETATSADFEPDHTPQEEPEPSLWSLGRLPQRKRTAEEASMLENSNKGKQFVRQLLDASQPYI